MGHWSEETWQEAFERRFLPGWKGFKRDEDSWRAIFLRYVLESCTGAHKRPLMLEACYLVLNIAILVVRMKSLGRYVHTLESR